MKKLKLYVWENVLTDYTDGIIFALASTVEEARAKVLKKDSLRPVADAIMAEPDVYDSPIGFTLWGGGG